MFEPFMGRVAKSASPLSMEVDQFQGVRTLRI